MFPGIPPIQQAREILASLHLEGSKFSVEADLLQRLEQTWGQKVTLATRKVSARPGFSGAAIQVGDTLIIVCPEEGGEALRGPIIAHEGARLILSVALEEEVNEFLGRGRYQRVEGSPKGYRNGHRPRSLACGAGEVTVEAPRVAKSRSPFPLAS